MSGMTFTILDGNRAIHSRQHGSFFDLLVAALSAEPETIGELEAALARFVKPDAFPPLAGWHRGACDEPYDAGIAIVDLAARLVATQSTYSEPGPTGEVLYRDAERDIETWLPYHVSEDWRFVYEIDAWEGLSQSRRHERQATPRLDARQVLYGQVAEFVVAECLAARDPASPGGTWTPPEGWTLQALPERAKPGEPIPAGDAVAEIHARWLMTPRDDLGGRSPRDLLVEKRDHLAWDLQDRSQQWSLLGACPPALTQASAAFRLGGFGAHENIVYYDLVRRLVEECWQRVVEPAAETAASAESLADLHGWLRQVQDQWLSQPDFEDFSGRTPAEVIRYERVRIPMACSGSEAMVDDDCPLCQMIADSPQPMFWCLDGCNMDDDFPFSLYCRTRQEWEEERREREESYRKFEAEHKCKQDMLQAALPGSEESGRESIWTGSYSNSAAARETRGSGCSGWVATWPSWPRILKASPETAAFAKSLSRQFGNLRSALEDPAASLVAPVTDRFCEEIEAASDARPDLAAKCADLARQLREFAAAVAGNGEDDIPY